jgi:hypothetical protein
MYIMLKWCQNIFVNKIGEKNNKQTNLIVFTTCKFVMACCDKNLISDSTIQKKKRKKKLYGDVARYSTS